jgi:tetratricopeptide (TPR) repeat protein
MPAPFRPFLIGLCLFALIFGPAVHAQQLAAPTAASAGKPTASTNAPSSKLTSPGDAAQQMIADAMKRMNANDVDGALNSLSQAIKLNPNSTGAYVLRASIYCQKKQWTQAEDDFKAAARIAPKNAVLQFNLIEVKFMQKQYDVARPGYVALEKDPDMGDFASYKVFLCDLFGGHEAAAKKDLDVFNEVMGNPSYYFANAAWALYHRDLDTARDWFLSASRIYPPRKNAYYSQSLRDLGYLPIPEPGDVVTPAPSGAAPAHP